MVNKSLASSFSFRSISKITILYSLCSLFIFLFLLQVIVNDKEKYLTDLPTLTIVEKEYRRKYNLIDGPAEIDKECTLGNSLILL